MFKRENRLVRGIKLDNSCLISNPQFILKKKKNGLLVNRFGVVVSKKIDKRAVVRNRIKRIFRFSLEVLNKNMNPGHDMLFIIRAEALNKTKEENQNIIKNVIEKAGLVKNER